MWKWICSMVLFGAAAGALAQDTSQDEARIEALVAEINAANKKPDVPNLFGQVPGTTITNLSAAPVPNVDSVAVPIDADSTVAEVDPNAAPVEPVEPELVPGSITFEQLSRVIGKRVRVRTVNGRSYDGDVVAVKKDELTLNARMKGAGSFTMPIKKAQISAITLF